MGNKNIYKTDAKCYTYKEMVFLVHNVCKLKLKQEKHVQWLPPALNYDLHNSTLHIMGDIDISYKSKLGALKTQIRLE